jgi:NAD(P)H-hydrate epimerase
MKKINTKWVTAHTHPRNKEGFKKSFGHVLIIAGSKGKMGAAILCARAALHNGCGMVTAFIPKSIETALLTVCPEAMTIVHEKIALLDLSVYDSIAIGPGLGLSKQSNLMVQFVIKNFKGPIVIDADAITLITKDLTVLSSNHILTPHPLEFARLQGVDYDHSSRALQVKNFIDIYPVHLVLKGAATLVAAPFKTLMVNTTGNDGMATAGSGDVLTGMIASLCAQKYLPFEAACIGVFMHGLAADNAITHQSKASLVASDIIKNLQHCRLID